MKDRIDITPSTSSTSFILHAQSTDPQNQPEPPPEVEAKKNNSDSQKIKKPFFQTRLLLAKLSWLVLRNPTLEEIKEFGEKLGEGKFGKAYRIDDRVYKVYHLPLDGYGGENPAERAVKYWNETYKKIYNGQYAHLATATFFISKNKRGSKYGHPVTNTPFIKGTPHQSKPNAPRSTDGISKVDLALLSAGIDMFDKNNDGNFIRVEVTIAQASLLISCLAPYLASAETAPENFHELPADFDNVILREPLPSNKQINYSFTSYFSRFFPTKQLADAPSAISAESFTSKRLRQAIQAKTDAGGSVPYWALTRRGSGSG